MPKILILRVGLLSLGGDSDGEGTNAELAADANQALDHGTPDGGGINFGTIHAELLTDAVIGLRGGLNGVTAFGVSSNIVTI